jgi:hypothetical protein
MRLQISEHSVRLHKLHGSTFRYNNSSVAASPVSSKEIGKPNQVARAPVLSAAELLLEDDEGLPDVEGALAAANTGGDALGGALQRLGRLWVLDPDPRLVVPCSITSPIS